MANNGGRGSATRNADGTSTGLTPKAEAFAHAMVRTGGKIAQSQREAGYVPSSANGQRLVKNPRVAARIDELRTVARQYITVSDRELFQTLSDISRSDISDFLDDNLQVLPISQWPEGASKMVQELTVVEMPSGKRQVRLRLWDKMAATKQLADVGGLMKRADRTPRNVHVVLNYQNGPSIEGDAGSHSQSLGDAPIDVTPEKPQQLLSKR